MTIQPPSNPQHELISFFEQVSLKQSEYWHQLPDHPGFSVNASRWCFTLPCLYQFFQRQLQAFSSMEYAQFRKLLFSLPINQVVKKHGAEIIIVDNKHKVDQSEYALIWEEMPYDRS